MSTHPLAYIPGRPAPVGGPLSRYLPPIPDGIGTAWLARTIAPGSWVLDPFGSAPRLAVEAARAGYRVLSAVNNPIARFLFELNAHPPQASELRQALADLAASQRAGERLEPHLRGLYQTHCMACGQTVEAQAFVWEKGKPAPTSRIYTCPACKDSGERPATPADIERAMRFSPGELHRARALERVTPMADPDRVYAEEALEMYLPRAVYALFTLVNKLEGQPAPRRRLLAALLLAAFDQANVLWPSPTGRLRPRQLSSPTRFLEKNVWLALEEAVEAWPASLPLATSTESELPLTIWPELPPESGGICLFEGRLRDLSPLANRGEERASAGNAAWAGSAALAVNAALAVLPRPNQAYWTLSALWAGWLWGHEANASFKNVLRRRRYDWSWQSEALSSALHSLAHILPHGGPVFGLLSEAEPGFVSASLLAAENSGFELDGLALRLPEGLAQIGWRRGESDQPPTAAVEAPAAPIEAAAQAGDGGGEESPNIETTAGTNGDQDRKAGVALAAGEAARADPANQAAPTQNGKPEAVSSRKISAENVAFARRAVQAYMHQRGEPAPYLILHTAALQALIQAGQLPPSQPGSPADLLQQTEALLEQTFSPAGPFTRFVQGGRSSDPSGRPSEPTGRPSETSGRSGEAGSRSLESGMWWSETPEDQGPVGNGTPEGEEYLSLADRVEIETVRYLLKNPGCTAEALDQALCQAFTGLVTPERELGYECLSSYAEPDPAQGNTWRLRAEDIPGARRAELGLMSELLQRTGERLGFPVEQTPFSTRPLLVWHSPVEAVEGSPSGKARTRRKNASKSKSKAGDLEPAAPAAAGQGIGFYVTASAVLSGVLPVTPPVGRGWVVLPGGRARLLAFKLRRDPRLRAAAEKSWRFVKFRHLRRLAEDQSLSRANLDSLLELDPLENSDPQLSLF